MNCKKYYTQYYKSKIGIIEVCGTKEKIVSVSFADVMKKADADVPQCVEMCIKQLDEYFCGLRKVFDIPLQLSGTDFQKRVWKALQSIPYAETISYKDAAKKIGKEKAARAVGNANKNNKIVIIVPCHRVIANNGDLGGFSSGLSKKEWLLEHEKQGCKKQCRKK